MSKTKNTNFVETANFEDFEELIKRITKKVGVCPQIPVDLPKGDWSEQALKVLDERYLLRDKDGKTVESPEQMCWRVAWEIASAEGSWGKSRKEVLETAKEFYTLFVNRDFLPNSPTLMNAGTGNRLQYSACFVLPVEDDMGGIFDALKYQALIHKSGGGTGFSFSRLRPKGAMVRSSKGTASGPISFMRIFDAATNEVKQGGKRRGANMGILRVDHPDILEFIHCKEEGGITNFNISIAITDNFMKAYRNNEDYDLINPKTKMKAGSLSAVKVFDEIAQGAWKTGDPGLIFIDRINKGSSNPIPTLGPIESTNPCGEQPLYPFDACNLGSIFLNRFVRVEGAKRGVDWKRLKNLVQTTIRFLDDVIEVNPYPLSQIRNTVLATRRIGLGVGGWADMLVELGIAYDSEEALELAEKVMSVIQKQADKTSRELAAKRGAFPLWGESIYKSGSKRRNSTVTTIAPTGSISIIAGASSGIEPLFAVAYQHVVKDKHLSRTLSFVNPKLEEVGKREGFWSEEIKEKVATQGMVRDIDEIPQHVRQIFGTAHEVHQDWHIRMQSAFQKYTENAVSKTINMKHDATVEEVKKAYLLAWETGCNGITIFRDGCKDVQVLNLGIKGEKKEENLSVSQTIFIRPFKAAGATYKLATPVGTAFITINEDEIGEPLELFINIGKAGSEITAFAEALGRTISTALRFRGHLSPRERAKEISDQLAGIGGRRSVGFGPRKILSLPDAVAVALSSHFGFKVVDPHVGTANGNGNGIKTNGVTSGNGYALHTNGKAGADVVADDPPRNGAGQSYFNNSYSDPTSAPVESSPVSETGVHQLSLDHSQHADICPSCGASSFVYEEGCSKCHACGHSEC